MLHLILQSVAAAVAVYFGELDASISEEGFAKKYQEANEFITWISRSKAPSKFWLRLYNYSLTGLFFAASFVIPYWLGMPELSWSIFVAQVIDSLGHVRAISKWKKAFATNGENLFEGRKWWQKFLW